MFGFDVVVAPAETVADHDVFGALLQYPSATGEVTDISTLIEAVHANKGIVAVAADLISLALLKSPGELGADAVIGSSQRFGVPMGYGGPHAAFFTTSDKYKRSLPGRIIGVSKDTVVTQHYVWQCKRVNNIFAVKKPTLTFVPRKYY